MLERTWGFVANVRMRSCLAADSDVLDAKGGPDTSTLVSVQM